MVRGRRGLASLLSLVLIGVWPPDFPVSSGCPDHFVTRSVLTISLSLFLLTSIFFFPMSSILFLMGDRLIPALKIRFSQCLNCLCNFSMLRSAESFRSQDLPRMTSFLGFVSFMVLVSATRCCVSMLITLLTREQKAPLASFTLVARSWLLDPGLESEFSNL